MDKTLKSLLVYSKTTGDTFTWQNVRFGCLGALYHYDMALIDVVRVVFKAHEQLQSEQRFHVSISEPLIFAPVLGPSRLKDFPLMHDTFDIEQFYNAILNKMMNDFRFSSVGWCREELGLS